MRGPGRFLADRGGGRLEKRSPSSPLPFPSALFEFIQAFAGIFFITVALSRLAALSGEPPLALAPPLGAAAWAGRFFFCLWTGYFEETLFRKYIPEKLAVWGIGESAAVAFSTALFACLHQWEGFWGVSNAVLAALYLRFCYRRRRNLHAVALAHAAHNFAVAVFAGGASSGGAA